MPQGLAAVTSRPARRAAPGLRPLFKPLVGAFLVLIGVLSPIDGPELPEPLDNLAGPSQASAQTGPVIPGRPGPCPAPGSVVGPLDAGGNPRWRVDAGDESQCVLVVPPCLETPWDGSQYLEPSTEYPEFCEASVLSSDSGYTACVNATGVVVDDDGSVCRVIQNAICPSGVRVSSNNCRTVQRRTWTCPAGVPRNEFNTCYQAPAANYVTHPACEPGAPALPILDCAGYVGEDFVRDPTTVPCSSLDPPGHPSTFLNNANNHWCRYDSSLLDLDCHPPNPPCTEAWAVCIKRASQTGGCSVVSKSIGCRALQAALAAGRIRLADVRSASCEPCVILPFQPIPAACPEDLTDAPAPEPRAATQGTPLRAILREERDIRIGDPACYPVSGGTVWPNPPFPGTDPITKHAACEALASACPDPSPGRLAWASSHFAQLAVVNSPVTIAIHDVPTTYRTESYAQLSGGAVRIRTARLVEYPEPAGPDHLLRVWSDIDSSRPYGSVAGMANASGECVSSYLPLFKLVVRELWPDNPADYGAIRDLFGADSLDWWDAIPTDTERKRRTEARGLEWWNDLNAAEQEDRTARMTHDVSCDSSNGATAWCRWQPAGSGFFRLTGAGAWLLGNSGNRTWIFPDGETAINDALGRLDATGRASLLSQISGAGLTPQAIGINDTLTALLPIPRGGDPDTLFSTRASVSRCPPVDIRVRCTYPSGTGNYVTTEPIGVRVHEMRVSTVPPSS